ncbi:serine/threonine-protein kinase [Mariniblastus fucicola]|uniref:Serine/threonine-protein kinase PknB n=1 Tax=Mariniblastus fucicola TaxID=980251 RepID=A0A5B9P473_9BACT|nr:serine/threonine-protein kinase [Mariniblastus fucicola]QEG21034.1 Serine/threonine-protein kinase PknB [Mariniblastus fucicola]
MKEVVNHRFDALSSIAMAQVGDACDEFENVLQTEVAQGEELHALQKAMSVYPSSEVTIREALFEQLLQLTLRHCLLDGRPITKQEIEDAYSPEFEGVISDLSWEREPKKAAPLGWLGKYALQEEIGRGGMGVVYRATQSDGIQREVAVKVVQSDRLDDSALQRFEFERQALATMDHESIARVFDVGTSEDGRAFVVMELIDGKPLTEFCDEEKLSVTERLEVFELVCGAVQHAHQKGIIHRDLKPSNILASRAENGSFSVKVIDFGLARASERRDGLTEFGQLAGTLEYISPEQASLNPELTDTRTDIYSLGVILYELLTSSTPFNRSEFGKNEYQRALDSIKHDSVLLPSRRLQTESMHIENISENRKLDSKKLTRTVEGDLDWIVMKSIEKEADRRYQAVSELASDVSNFLTHDIVSARPPSAVYRVRKFVRKNRGVVASATAIVALMVGGIIGTGYGLVKANRARLNAEASAHQANTTLGIMTDSYKSSDPRFGAKQMSAKDVLEVAFEKTQNSELDYVSKDRILSVLSGAFMGLGEFNAAENVCQERVALTSNMFGKGAKETMEATVFLVEAMEATGNHNEAVPIIEAAIVSPACEASFEPKLKVLLARCYYAIGDVAEARTVYSDLLTLADQKLAKDDEDSILIKTGFASFEYSCGQYERCSNLRREIRDIQTRKFGIVHPSTIGASIDLAASLVREGKFNEVRKTLDENEKYANQLLGEQHPITLALKSVDLELLFEKQNHEDALKLVTKLTDEYRNCLGEGHQLTLSMSRKAVQALAGLGKYHDALKEADKSIGMNQKYLGEEHPETIAAKSDCAFVYSKLNRHSKAEKLRKEVYEFCASQLGEAHPNTIDSMSNYSESLLARKKFADAAQMCHSCIELIERHLGGDAYPEIVHPLTLLAKAQSSQGKLQEAIENYAHVYKLCRERFQPTNPRVLGAALNLGNACGIAGQSEQAISTLEPLFEEAPSHLSSNSEDAFGAQATLAGAYMLAERYKDAATIYCKLKPIAEQRYNIFDAKRHGVTNALNMAMNALRGQVQNLMAKEDFEKAQKTSAFLVENRSSSRQNNEAFARLSVEVAIGQRNWEAALEKCDVWSECASRQASVELHRAICLLELDRNREAFSELQGALEDGQLKGFDLLRALSISKICSSSNGSTASQDGEQLKELFHKANSLRSEIPDHRLWQIARMAERGIAFADTNETPKSMWIELRDTAIAESREYVKSRVSLKEGQAINQRVWTALMSIESEPSQSISQESLESMRRVCAQHPRQEFINTLALAECTFNNWNEAAAAAKESLSLTKKSWRSPHPIDLAILTSCNNKLGEKEAAGTFKLELKKQIQSKGRKGDPECAAFFKKYGEMLELQDVFEPK